MIIQMWWWSRLDDDPDQVMIQMWWWSKLDDNPDQVMIQLWWWSRLDENPDRVMIQMWWWSSSYEPVFMMIQIPWWIILEEEDDLKTRRQRRLEDEYNLKMNMTRWSNRYREEDQCWKLCRKNTFLVKRECWCICNFKMYSSMYLMYCNPIFIPGCFYYVFESCFLALMFWSEGSIM